MARTVFVTDDSQMAHSYGGADEGSPYRFQYAQPPKQMRKIGRLDIFDEHRNLPDEINARAGDNQDR